jgi:hypothetical protein
MAMIGEGIGNASMSLTTTPAKMIFLLLETWNHYVFILFIVLIF